MGPKPPQRRWPIVAAASLAFVTAAYFLFQDQVVDAKLRPFIEREASKALSAPVSIGSVRVGLTGNVVLRGLSLTIPGNPWEVQLKVKTASVNLGVFDLLVRRKPLQDSIEYISLVEPSAVLVKTDEPVSAGAGVSQASPPASPQKIPIPLIPVPKIFVRNGSFAIQAGKIPRPIVNELNFTASNDRGQAWGLSLSAHAPEAESAGLVRFNGSLQLADLKVAGKLILEKWPLVSAGPALKDLSGWEIQSGTIDAEMPIVCRLMGGVWFDAKANLWDASVKSPEPSGVVFSKVTGRVFIRPNELTVPGEIGFQVGETGWYASGLIPFDHRPLAVNTHTDKLFLSSVFSEILKIKNLKVDGMGSAVLAASGPIENPVVTGSAQLGESHIGDGQLDSLSVKADYSHGTVNLEEIRGKLYDGEIYASGTIPVAGMGDSPVSVKAVLTGLEARKIAALLGVEGMEGRSNAEVRLGGTLSEPVFLADSQTTLTRLLRNSTVEYSLKNNIQLRDQKLDIQSVFNDKTQLDCELIEHPDSWEMKRFSLVTGKKTENLGVTGTWPKAQEGALDMSFHGNGIDLQNLPFFKDQFPDVKGKVDLTARFQGTRKDPEVKVGLTSDAVQLSGLSPLSTDVNPEPMDLAFSWKPGSSIQFEKLEVGDIFSLSGELGLGEDSPMDLKIKAQGIPIAVLAEIGGWNNPPQPLEGNVTGKLYISGFRKNPIFAGETSVESLRVGDWFSDRLDASIGMEQGKLQIKKLWVAQGQNSLKVTGSWDTRAVPGVMNLGFTADGFQLGKGPSLSGSFLWQAHTGEPWWKNWNGTFSSPDFTLAASKDRKYKFSDFSTEASDTDSVFRGKIQLGKSISGTAVLNLSGEKPKIQASLKIAPALLAEAPEMTQFLPPFLGLTGKISGKLELAEGTFDTLPLEGNFVISDGVAQKKYDFDRMELKFSGNRSKIEPRLTLTREEAKYSLSGTFESPGSFWDSNSKVAIEGPFQGEKLSSLLALLGISADKHKVAGEVDGNFSMNGPLANPSIGFSVTGENLRFDDNQVPKAELNFTETAGKVTLGKNRVTLSKGILKVDQGDLSFDPEDSSLIHLDLTGSTEGVPVGILNLTGQVRLAGNLALEQKEDRPAFEGLISVVETGQGEENPRSFDLNLSVLRKVINLKPLDNNKTQLLGQVDLSQDRKISFKNLHLENSKGQFSADGVLDLDGNSHFTCDAKDIPIEDVGKWILPDFPLSGTGSYHLVFDGTLDNPIFDSSFSISNGKIGDLSFDLLDGGLHGKENVLYLGAPEEPLVLSRKGLFSFNVSGKMPLALTHESWLKVRNNEMDIDAQMEKGDFSLILLAGLAEKASGEMNFSAHVGGTLDDPVLKMDLDISKASMVPHSYAHSVEDINGRIKVRDNKLVVEDLNARIGQGRIFITSPPIEQTKMVLENFIPQYLDFSVRTVGEKGLYLNIPGIMDDNEWGEIQFYGAAKEDPLLIVGPLTAPQIIGTASLQSGHYTFPPKEKNGKTVTYNALGNVTFDLSLVSGNNAWYSNDFAGQYLELKIDPGDQIKIIGKDSDKTPEAPGINCLGSAGSKEGWLRYLGHEFKMEQASIFMSKGKAPFMSGHATDKLLNVDVVSAGGSRKSDVDIWVDFRGTFGNIDFTLDSSPRFSSNDIDASQKILLSYIMFGQDMTGLASGSRTNYTPEELQNAYQQKFGQVAGQAALDAFLRIGSNKVTTLLRPLTHDIGGVDVDFNIGSGVVGSGSNAATEGGQVVDPTGNSLVGGKVPAVSFRLRKSLDPRLSVTTNFGLNRDIYSDKTGVQGQVGIQYDISKSLSLNAVAGSRDDGQQDTRIMAQINQPLPDIINPKKGDKEKPRFMRYDVIPFGLGKFHMVWETDKVTKGQVRVVDSDGNVVRDFADAKEYAYDHTADLEGLDPAAVYKIVVIARDPNQNENSDSVQTEALSE